MSNRNILVVFGLILAFAIPATVGAATTTITGTVVAPSTPAASSNLVVILFRGANEIARHDAPLTSSNNNTYSFSISVDSSQLSAGGKLTLKAHIVNQDRRIFFEGQEVPYNPGTQVPPLRVTAAPGTRILPRASAGSLILLTGIIAALLATGVTLWRRQRSLVLTQRFASTQL